MSQSKFEIYRSPNGEYRFRLLASNNEIVLSSEGYASKSGVEGGIESVRKNCTDRLKFDVKTSNDCRFYFNLHAANGEIIGTSQMYASKQHAENGIQTAGNAAINAAAEDIS